jgi:hypothetical protein
LAKRDVALKRGVWLEGQVTDADSGEPVRATVNYSAMANNAFLKMAPGFEQTDTEGFYHTDNTGHYRLPVLAGPGVVTVNASDPRRYPTGVMSERLASEYPKDGELLQTGTGLLFPLGINYLASIHPAEAAKREDHDIRLKTAPSVVVRLLDAEGKPLSGVSITDYKEFRGFNSDDSSTLPADVYLARNFLATQPRRLIAWHPERNLAGQLFIREQPSGELTLTLQPAGTIRGRVVDDEGRPRPVRFIRSLTNIPNQLEYGLLPGTGEFPTTNRDGEFEFRWLIPGVKYRVTATHPIAGQFLGMLFDGVTVAAGETRELGDVQLGRERP